MISPRSDPPGPNADPGGDPWALCLYVAGMTPLARLALANVQQICEAHLPAGFTLSVVDLLTHPAEAEPAQILAVPTLVRQQPGPSRRVIGDLTDTDRVLKGLELGGAR